MFGFRSLRGVTPQLAAEVRERLHRLVLPEGQASANRGTVPVHTEENEDSHTSDRVESDPGPDRSSADTTGDRDPRLGSPESEGPRLRRGHLVMVAVLLALAIGGALVVVLRQSPAPEPVPESSPSPTTANSSPPDGSRPATDDSGGAGEASDGGATSPPSERLVVHVAGKVRDPGVVRLPSGARVVEAIEAAGGAKPGADLGTVNLARPLEDGEQVLVDTDPPAGGVAPGPGGLGADEDGAAEPIDLNTATLEELEEIPGIGPALGQRILDFRSEQGGFSQVEELQEVSGIGTKRFADMQDRVVVR